VTLHHEERPSTTLAHGPAKSNDIDRVRREVGTAKESETTEPGVERALDEMKEACATIREDVEELKRTMGRSGRSGGARGPRAGGG
jgi:hypothetical protein